MLLCVVEEDLFEVSVDCMVKVFILEEDDVGLIVNGYNGFVEIILLFSDVDVFEDVLDIEGECFVLFIVMINFGNFLSDIIVDMECDEWLMLLCEEIVEMLFD